MYNVAISGANIEYYDKFIIKRGGERLKRQAAKQYQFTKLNFKFKTPYIISLDNGFKMERVGGQGWYDFFIYSPWAEVNRFINQIIDYLMTLKKISMVEDIKLRVLNKLATLNKRIEFIERPGFSIEAPISFCHGDLTFSNMIFGNDIYLIDFLDCFVESYWMDIIKLRQDLVYHWCLLYNKIETVKLFNIFNYMNNRINDVFEEEIKSQNFKILEFINILRLEPYLPVDKKYILDIILEKNEIFNSAALR